MYSCRDYVRVKGGLGLRGLPEFGDSEKRTERERDY